MRMRKKPAGINKWITVQDIKEKKKEVTRLFERLKSKGFQFFFGHELADKQS